MVKFKETRRQNGIQNKHSTVSQRNKKKKKKMMKTRTFLGQICYKFRTRHIQDETQSVRNFKTN